MLVDASYLVLRGCFAGNTAERAYRLRFPGRRRGRLSNLARTTRRLRAQPLLDYTDLDLRDFVPMTDVQKPVAGRRLLALQELGPLGPNGRASVGRAHKLTGFGAEPPIHFTDLRQAEQWRHHRNPWG